MSVTLIQYEWVVFSIFVYVFNVLFQYDLVPKIIRHLDNEHGLSGSVFYDSDADPDFNPNRRQSTSSHQVSSSYPIKP